MVKMPCFHPLDARRSPGGKIGFKPMTPFDTLLKLPCGRCIGCKLEKSRQWAVRGMHEASLQNENCYITLTIKNAEVRPQDEDSYCAHQDMCTNEKTLSLTTDAQGTRVKSRAKSASVDNARERTVRVPYANGTRDRPSMACPEGTGPSLSIRDHQLFMKRLIRRLREAGPIRPIRFLMCGEYGEKKGRPHYHYILFGYDFPDKKYLTTRNGHKIYRSDLLEQIWPHGLSEVAGCSFESIAYVARYVTKKITGELADEHYKRQTRQGRDYWLQPEFNAMSRNGGIGKKWIQKFKTSVYPHDRVIVNAKPAKPPRAYDLVLEKTDPTGFDQVKAEREKQAKIRGEQPPERLRAGEAITRAGLKKRPLE